MTKKTVSQLNGSFNRILNRCYFDAFIIWSNCKTKNCNRCFDNDEILREKIVVFFHAWLVLMHERACLDLTGNLSVVKSFKTIKTFLSNTYKKQKKNVNGNDD